ncbi:chromate transporter [Paenibacillus sp. R14(2021)]|uniref:chromate transporter n=1 Tax=Paenibacillus sp. R14(2021) TaxID=2859228 RepID=UPI001C6159CD|nr:chromate transporter [Paenibacillus sp. R14(2021)]
MRTNQVWQLYMSMARTGIVGFGGGPSVIPLIRHEAVKRHQWMTDDEFAEVLAIANTLPGPIATKMAAYLGHRLLGAGGAIGSVLAHILPSGLAILALYTIATQLAGSHIVSMMIAAVNPVIAVMLGQMTYEFLHKTVKGFGVWVGMILFCFVFALIMFTHLHPAIMIVLFLGYGFFHYKLVERLMLKAVTPKKGGYPS